MEDWNVSAMTTLSCGISVESTIGAVATTTSLSEGAALQDLPSLLPVGGDWSLGCVAAIQLLIFASCGILIFLITSNKNNLRNQTNQLILNQTFADLLNSTVFIPLSFVYFVRPSLPVYNWISHLNVYIIIVSLLSLEAFALFRYLKVRKPLDAFRNIQRSDLFGGSRLIKIVACIWFVPILISAIPLAWSTVDPKKRAKMLQYYLGFIWFLLFLMFSSLSVVYYLLFCAVRGHLQRRGKAFGANRLPFPGPHDANITQTATKPSKAVTPQTQNFQPRRLSERTLMMSHASSERSLPATASQGDFKQLHNTPAGQKPWSVRWHGRSASASGGYPTSSESGDSEVLASQNQTEHRQERSIGSGAQKREKRMIRLLGALITSFFISYFPIVCINFVFLFKPNVLIPGWFHTLSFYAFICNSAVNPTLCICMKQDLNATLRTHISCLARRVTRGGV